MNNPAWEIAASLDARIRNGKLAVKLAERAGELIHYQETMMVGSLAAAYAEAGGSTRWGFGPVRGLPSGFNFVIVF